MRIIGVVIFLYGIGYLLDGSLFKLGYFVYADSSPAYYVIVGVAYCTAGLYLMRGGPHIVGFAYPAAEEEEEDYPDEEAAEKEDA